MAINFPNSPSVDDTFTSGVTTYKWNGTVWKVLTSAGGKFTIAETTPPTGALAGDTWFDSGTGYAYIYYDDGTSSQWVQIIGPVGPQGPTGATGAAGSALYSVNNQTGTSYTTVLGDAQGLVTMSNASANTISIPTNTSVAYPIGSSINIIQTGSGITTINAVNSGTTTVLSNGITAAAPKLRAIYSSATAIKAGTDLWYIVGDIA
jgi:hypothetical protein